MTIRARRRPDEPLEYDDEAVPPTGGGGGYYSDAGGVSGDQQYRDMPRRQLEPAPSGQPAPRQYTAEEATFRRNNPGDEGRMAAALSNVTDEGEEPPPRMFTDVGAGRPDQRDDSALTQLLKQLGDQQQADRQRQQMERAALRDLMMGRMAEASKPVDVKAPGIREQLSAQRLARQRSAERQRSQAAVRLAGEGLGDSGAMDTTLSGIEELRGEGESSDIADVLGKEHQAKRAELMQLYQMAAASGDAEMARNVQQQLAAIDAQIQQQGMSDVNRRFGQDLGFRKSSFMDNLGLQLLQTQLGANAGAAGAFF